MNKFKWTYLFALIVALLIGFTLFDLQKSERDSEREERESKVVSIEPEKLTAIELTNLSATGEDASNLRRLEKKDGLWYVASPFIDSADQQAVATLVEGFESEKITETISGPVNDTKNEPAPNLAQFGLDKPLMTLKLESADKSETLKIGSIKAYDGSLYGHVNSGRVVLVSSAWSVYLSKPAHEFRDKRVFRSDVKDKFSELRLKGRIENRLVDIEMKRDDKRNWYLPKDPTRKLSEKSVDAYLEEVKALRAFDFSTSTAAAVSARANKSGAFTIETLSENKSKPFVLTLYAGGASKTPESSTDSNIEAVSSDLELGLLVYRPAANELMKPPEHFYDRQAPFQFPLGDVSQIEIEKDGVRSQIDLQRASDSTKLNELIQRLSRLEAVRFLANGAVSRQQMNSKIRLLKADGSLVFEMSWGDTVTEKAQGDKPEAILLPVYTNLFREPVAVAEGSVKALDLENLTK